MLQEQPKRRGVSAAEKYAEGPRPRCECHGEEMLWNRDARCHWGGWWSCSEKERERARRWREANPEKERERMRRWYEANPEKHRESVRRRKEAKRFQGLCVACGKEPAITAFYCWVCAEKHNGNY